MTTAKSQLNGSYSGLWSCDLCGHTGAACRCEHFNRGTGAWGPDKRLSDAEMAAEQWRMILSYYRTHMEEHQEQAEQLRSLVFGADTRSEGFL